MTDYTLRHFDTVMWLLRHEEGKYQGWADSPPERPVEGGLFGLGGLGLSPPPTASSTNALAAIVAPPPPLPQTVQTSHKDDQRRTLTFIEKLCRDLELQGGADRVELLRDELNSPYVTYKDCYAGWRALREQIEKELERRSVFYIQKEAAEQLLNRDKEWAGVFAAFPAVRQDVQCALRCFGFDQYTAAVFHMMRVAEVGLRAVAKERKFKLPKDKPIDAAQWGELTTRLNTAIEKISNWKAKDDKKQPALSFYTAVRADTVFFKDRYRNLVSHSTAHFSVEDANSVIRRVREFMGVVSSRLDETAKPIRWTK